MGNVEDDVYLESDAEREEYVLSQTGLIFRGASKSPSALHWNFAQVRKDEQQQYEMVCLCHCVVSKYVYSKYFTAKLVVLHMSGYYVYVSVFW